MEFFEVSLESCMTPPVTKFFPTTPPSNIGNVLREPPFPLLYTDVQTKKISEEER